MTLEELIETLKNDVWLKIFRVDMEGRVSLEFSITVRKLKKYLDRYGSREVVAIWKHKYSDPRELEVYLEEI